MKRKIDQDFIKDCEQKFNDSPINKLARNSINAVGSKLSTTNSDQLNNVSHIFLNSLKRKNIRATNQGASGRCWMFASLNIFRHCIINALDLDQFEFSEVYLFFWDKLERANSVIQWFINNPEYNPGDKPYEYMLENYMSDGGWWNTFTNLATKYGLVPGDAMRETYQSDDSDEMNKIISEILHNAINQIRKNKSKLDLEKFREKVVRSVYDTLVKFLGEPPKNFCWSYTTSEGENSIMSGLNPKKFYDMVVPVQNMNEFVTLSNIPYLKYFKNYRISDTNNVVEGEECKLLNLPINELAKYVKKSISAGFSVWFAGDVRQNFNWYHSCLDDKLHDDSIFGERDKFEKGERILLHNVEGTHAMAITGFNEDEKGRVTNWQVENSWGYCDNEIPGLDGFLNMSSSWFEKYVIQVVVHKNFLSRTLKKLLKEEPEVLAPWDNMAPALRVGGTGRPEGYARALAKARETRIQRS
jgi:bleomycin hydrolase